MGANDYDSHVWDGKREDAQYLLDAGETEEVVARRVGVHVDTIQKWFEKGKLVRR